jgi:hypothetical protein
LSPFPSSAKLPFLGEREGRSSIIFGLGCLPAGFSLADELDKGSFGYFLLLQPLKKNLAHLGEGIFSVDQNSVELVQVPAHHDHAAPESLVDPLDG